EHESGTKQVQEKWLTQEVLLNEPFRSGAEGGLEPPRYCYRQPLKLVRLPIPPLPRAGDRNVADLDDRRQMFTSAQPVPPELPARARCAAVSAPSDRARPGSTATASDPTAASAACGRPAPSPGPACRGCRAPARR